MEEIVRLVSENWLIAIAVIFAVLMLFYFLFKSLVKLVLILTLIAVAVGGYFYFRHPENRPANLKEAVQKVRTGAGQALEKGRELVDKGRETYEKGKEIVEKGRDATGNIAKTLGGEKDAGSRQGP